MKYIFACFCCFILSSCATIPDQAYHKIACANPDACSKAELDSYIDIEPKNDYVVMNGWSILKRGKDKVEEDKVEETSFSIFYLEYNEDGEKFEGNRQLDIIKRAIETSDKPIYLNVYVNSWHNNANTKESSKITPEAKYFPYILARSSFRNPDMNVIGVYIGWQGEKYKYSPTKWITPKSVSDIADRIGGKGHLRADIISMVNNVQRNPHSGHTLIMGKSFGARLLSKAFINDLVQMKSIEDWPLGSRSLLVNLNPAIGANAFDKVFKNMPGKGSDVQRPIWLNMTSEDDKATNWIYSSARLIGQNLSDESVEIGMDKTHKAIGHYMPYLSHWVTVNKKNVLYGNKKCSPTSQKWFEIPLRDPNQDSQDEQTRICDETRYLYKNNLDIDGDTHYRTTIFKPLYYTAANDAENLGYMWNIQTDKSVIANGSADSIFSKGYHSADVQTILGRMLDDMLFTPPEKPLD
ncbi:hypothetical protein QL886_10625 [Psychrobacter sp. APC 3281]|uniref:hypothetical protein n=1 Tax=Psychrobacter sp. APC 3281 TaxID=3035190 RepID=UPI0025B44CC2|nr:hypothetical protein [Psychrobacter sp. APC 3281]MDN3448092.1 hypothetical protein [Psychrobacter sp. APC 3281]